MNPTKRILLVLLTSILILLAACAPEATTAPEGEQENLVQPGATEDSYPAPDENQAVQSGDLDEPYPRPQDRRNIEYRGSKSSQIYRNHLE